MPRAGLVWNRLTMWIGLTLILLVTVSFLTVTLLSNRGVLVRIDVCDPYLTDTTLVGVVFDIGAKEQAHIREQCALYRQRKTHFSNVLRYIYAEGRPSVHAGLSSMSIRTRMTKGIKVLVINDKEIVHIVTFDTRTTTIVRITPDTRYVTSY